MKRSVLEKMSTGELWEYRVEIATALAGKNDCRKRRYWNTDWPN